MGTGGQDYSEYQGPVGGWAWCSGCRWAVSRHECDQQAGIGARLSHTPSAVSQHWAGAPFSRGPSGFCAPSSSNFHPSQCAQAQGHQGGRDSQACLGAAWG